MKIDPVAAMWMPGVRATTLPPVASPIGFLAFLTGLDLAAAPVDPARQGDSAPAEQDQPEREAMVETGSDAPAEPGVPLPQSAPVAWRRAPVPGDSGGEGLPTTTFVSVQPITTQHEPTQSVAATPDVGQPPEPGQDTAPPRVTIPLATDVTGKTPEPGRTPPLPGASPEALPWRQLETGSTETRNTTVPDLRTGAKGGQPTPASPLTTTAAQQPALAPMASRAARPADGAPPEKVETSPVAYPRQPQAAQRAIEYTLAFKPEPSRHAAQPAETERPLPAPGMTNLPANKAQTQPMPARDAAMTAVADTDGPGQPAPDSLPPPMIKGRPAPRDASALSQRPGGNALIPEHGPAIYRPAKVMPNLRAETVSPAKAAPEDAAPILRHLRAETVSPAKAAPEDAAPKLRQTGLPVIIKSDQPIAAPAAVGTERPVPALDRAGWPRPTLSEPAFAAPAAAQVARPEARPDTLPPGTAMQNRQTTEGSALHARHATAPSPTNPVEATAPDLPAMSTPRAPAEVPDPLTHRAQPAPTGLSMAGEGADSPLAPPQTSARPVQETRRPAAGTPSTPPSGSQQPAPTDRARWGIALAGRTEWHERSTPLLAQGAGPLLSTPNYKAAARPLAVDVPQPLATDLPLARPLAMPPPVEQPAPQDSSFGLRVDPAAPSAPADTQQPRHTPADARPAPPVPQQIAEAVRQTTGAQIELTLSPDELGRVTLSFLPEGDGVRVHLVTERPETLDLLRRHIPELAGELRAAGYDTASFSFGRQGQAPRDAPVAAPGTLSDSAPAEPALPSRQRVASGTLDIRL